MSTQFATWAEQIDTVEKQWRPHAIIETLRDKRLLPIFGRLFFPTEISDDVPQLHFQIAEALSSDAHETIIVPRGHGKTTWSRIDLIHDIVYEREPFIVLVGDTASASQHSLGFIRRHLETNERLIQAFGNLVPPFSPTQSRKWTDSRIETITGINVIALGFGKGRGLNIRGHRPTKCLIDDVEDRDGVRSQDTRRKQKEWLYQTLLPAMDRERGKVKMMGTVLHYDSVLLDFYKKFGGIKRAALENEDGSPSLNGTPIWWSMEELNEKKRQIGSLAFAQEYMNNPSTDEHSDVKLAWIRHIDNFDMVDMHNRSLYKIFSALDPNISTSEHADEAAITTVAKKVGTSGKDIELIVISCEHGQWGMSRTIEIAKRMWERYPHEKFGVETVAFQEHLRQTMGQHGIPARPIKVSKDKRARLQEITPLIEFGNIKFMPGTEDLIQQLIEFPHGDKDDRVDSFVHACKMAIDSGSQKFFCTVL